jgi:flavin reductase (DIM6/NTAB) family NADH-FMN oxidoreductase RutF
MLITFNFGVLFTLLDYQNELGNDSLFLLKQSLNRLFSSKLWSPLMIIDFEKLTSREIYKTMIQMVIPRPIAWVISPNESGSLNLAPFSYFNVISSDPPLVSISIGCKKGGELKDTRKNIIARDFFTINIPHVGQAQLVTDSAKPFAAEESEISALDLGVIEQENFTVPRLKDCKAAFFCVREQVIDVGNVPQGLVIAKVLSAFIDDSCASYNGDQLEVDPLLLNPLARLGGNDYCSIGSVFTVTPS